jgi:carbon-monoxide dehydrogenase medium subunit
MSASWEAPVIDGADELEPEDRSLEYHAPRSITDALAVLAQYEEDAKLLAGGQSLLVLLRNGLIAPTALIGLQHVPELHTITPTPDGGLTIGAMTTFHTLETSAVVRERYPALAEAVSVIASPQVRQRGTLGGNLCHADPTGDPPAALIALDAAIEIANAAGTRHIPVAELFRDYMETILDPGDLLTAIHLPPPPAGSSYLKHRLRGVDTALVGAAAGLSLAPDGACTTVRIGLVGAATTPIRAINAEAELLDKPVTSETIQAAAAAAAAESDPLSDTEASETYRREMVAVFVRRTLTRAHDRAINRPPTNMDSV